MAGNVGKGLPTYIVALRQFLRIAKFS